MKPKALFITLMWLLTIAFPLKVFSQDNLDCYTIIVGKKVSTTGHVIVAHNEDDWGNLIVNIYKVPRIKNSSKYYTLINGKKIPQPEYNFGYLWFETTDENFGDMLVNDNGVSICSNACPSKEDTAKGLLTYDFRLYLAQHAINAKDAVILAGKLLDKYGYASSGRTYTIADSSQAWVLAVVRGHHWVAERVPDDEVAIIPNYYTIERINLKDKRNFLGSKDIISYAIKRGWYDPKSGKPFNFKLAYSRIPTLYSIGNVPRHWSGVNQLADTVYAYGSDLPFCFKPKHKLSPWDLAAVLSSHYEGTDFEAHKNLRPNPHVNIIHRICNMGTKFSALVQFASEPDKTIVWWAPFNPCIEPYVPLVEGMPYVPKQYHARAWTQARKLHFVKDTNTFEANPELAFSIFHTYNQQINKDYWRKEKAAKRLKHKIQAKGLELMSQAHNLQQMIKVSDKMLLMLYNEEKEHVQK